MNAHRPPADHADQGREVYLVPLTGRLATAVSSGAPGLMNQGIDEGRQCAAHSLT